MTASVQVKDGRPNYYIVLSYKNEQDNKWKTKWIATDIPVKGNNKRKAEKRKKEILEEYGMQVAQGIDLSRDVLFVVFIREWLESRKRYIRITTYESYSINVDRHIVPFFEPMKLKVKDMTPAHILNYINHQLKRVSPNTVIKHLANMSKCLDSAVSQKIISFNPVKSVSDDDMPQKKKFTGAKFYNEKQIERLLECSKDDPLELVIMLTVFYGLRRSEVIGLRWDAIDMVNNTISIRHTVVQVNKNVHKMDATKNEVSNAVIPLPDMIKSRLKKWKAQQAQHKLLQPNDYNNDGYVCTQVDGSLIKPNYVTQHFKRLLINNDLPIIRFHDLRHSSASYLKYLGFDLKDIQTWLRHSDIQTTMNIYTHLDMEAKQGIAERLDERFRNFGSSNSS